MSNSEEEWGDGVRPRAEADLPNYKWYVLGVLFLAAVISYTDRLILNVLVEPLKHDLFLSDTDVSFLQGAAFAVIYSLAALPLGRLADLVNRKRLLLAGIVLWTVGTAACALATSFPQLFIARVVVGMGEAGLFPAGVSILVAYFPAQQRATAIGIFFMGSAVGAGAAIFGGGILLTVIGGLTSPSGAATFAIWRRVLLALVAPGIVVAALLAGVREPSRKLATKSNQALGVMRGLVSLWRARQLVTLLLAAQIFQATADYGSSAWTPTLLVRKFSLAPGVAALHLGGVVLIAAAIGPTVGGFLSDRLQANGKTAAKPMVTAVAFFAGVPLTYFCFAASAWHAILLFGLLTATMGIGIVAAVAAIQDVVDDSARGTAVALQSFLCTLIGLGCGPTLVAFLSDRPIGGNDNVLGNAIAMVVAPGLLLGALAALGAYANMRSSYK